MKRGMHKRGGMKKSGSVGGARAIITSPTDNAGTGPAAVRKSKLGRLSAGAMRQKMGY